MLSTHFLNSLVDRTFLSLITRESIQQLIADNNGTVVLLHFVELLSSCMSSENVAHHLCNTTLSICKDFLLPVLNSSSSSNNNNIEIRLHLDNLLYNCLFYQWKYYFFSSQDLNTQQNHTTRLQFFFVMENVLNSLKSSDINAAKQALKHLDSLNNSRLLFQRELFATEMSGAFVKTILNVLCVAKLHDILKEDYIQCLYKIVQQNWPLFANQVLKMWLSEQVVLNDAQKQALLQKFASPVLMDMPSFAMNMSVLINDYKYYSKVYIK